MASPRTKRLLKFVAATPFALLLCAFTYVQITQRILRYHAEQLLADFHSIRLEQSTWADAQRLMHKWGAYGHYAGTCTAEACEYTIHVRDRRSKLTESTFVRLDRLEVFRVLDLLGDHAPRLFVRFTVEDGVVTRDASGLSSEVFSHLYEPEVNNTYTLGLDAKSRFSLTNQMNKVDSWVMGDEEQLADHPDYKIGRPSGCEGCEFAEVTYTPQLAQAEVDHLTAFNLNCFTRLRPCREFSDILPDATSWHLYDTVFPTAALHQAQPCHTSARALARDAQLVFVVMPVNDRTSVNPHRNLNLNRSTVITGVTVVRILKNASGLSLPQRVDVSPFSAEPNEPEHASEKLVAGKEALVFFSPQWRLPSSAASLELSWCGTLEATSDNISAALLGIQQDKSKHPIHDYAPWWE